MILSYAEVTRNLQSQKDLQGNGGGEAESLYGNKEASGHTKWVQNRETMTTVHCSKY